ncbi:class F sortase [Nocardioides psychrotolerans]|uniref:Sortase family protein n=1 Tax=Nocardioides psychrotolerans TaxID=1005945 RepID=A0A1I3HD75_9ACTN|nr:class F sortase [Nocardioides psychrotolerans]SFI33527.1 Sortase family protein [Nocardioides psychrotolerans]
MSLSRLARPVARPVTHAALALCLLLGALVLVLLPPGRTPAAEAATRVAKGACRSIDPNLVNGACLRWSTGRGSGLTWIGTYRAPDGRVFFCIDFLYDSRLPRSAPTVGTDRLVNQLGERVGDAEVAALNQVISTWAGDGSTGSDDRDAAIALVIREVMGDGVRPGGAVVYPQGLHVGEHVRPPIGGLGGPILRLAQEMWSQASRFRGPYELRMESRNQGPMRLGRTRTYRVRVLSAAGVRVPGVEVRFVCTGPIRCPRPVRSNAHRTKLRIKPHDVGRYRIRANAFGPAADGLLYRARSWRPHGGRTARPAGVQRGWIAQESRTTAVVQASAKIRKARPEVVTRTSEAVVTPGAEIHDVVMVTGLPEGYDAQVTATLFGPFADQPGAEDCTPSARAGSVTFAVSDNGTSTTPPVVVPAVGFYTWVESFPGDDDTVPVTTRCGIVEETTRVIPFTPTIRTTASQQRALVGDALHDRVVLGGIGESPVTIEWALHGPRAPRDGSCDDLAWGRAGIVASGGLAVLGDGSYRTPSTTLSATGCYTYSQRVAPTALTSEAVSPPGLETETALAVRRTPRVSTVASDQHALTGERISDTVRLRGLGADDRVTVRWWLHGPLAPRGNGSCDGLDWRGAPVVDRGELLARGNGTRETRSTLLEVAGCYTYRERLPATSSTDAAATRPGIPVETALLTRPVTPYVPEVPSGPTSGDLRGLGSAALLGGEAVQGEATVPTRRARPHYLHRTYRAPVSSARRLPAGRLSIPSAGIGAPVDGVGLDRGAMAIPDDRRRLGWLTTTSSAGELLGASVVSGHVSDRHERPGALWRLRKVRIGDVVAWTAADGSAHRFVVRRVQRFARTRGLPAELFRTDGPHVLHLVTCTTRRRTVGGFHYADNLVVTAVEVT